MATTADPYADRDTIVGVFRTHTDAQRAVRELKDAGFTDEQIGITHQHEDAEGYAKQHEDDETMAGEGAAAGAAVGAGTGALWALGIAAGMLPAVGPIIAGGILASVAASAAGAAAAGGLIGALIGLGIPEDEAEYYHSELKEGRTIVTVKAHDRTADAWRILSGAGAYDFRTRGEAGTVDTAASRTAAADRSTTAGTAATAAAATGTAADGKVVAREEVLDVDKETHQAGEARIRKEVHTDHVNVDVPVKKEELVIERHDVSGRAAGPITGEGTEEIRVPLREEEVDVHKRTVAKEEVEVDKRTVTGTKHVDADLKEEEIVVETEGEVVTEKRT